MENKKGKRMQSAAAEPQKGSLFKRFWKEWGSLIVVLLSIVVLLKVVFQVAWVPSGSMEPTIPTKSLQICWRLPYFLADPMPERGDVFTFWSEEEDKVLVKRVIGLPGDTISYQEGFTYLNGVRMEETYLAPQGLTSCEKTFTVPEGCVFFMGDNRTGSYDARFWKDPYISLHDLQAKVLLTISIGSNRSWQGVRLITK